jgi:hypothetical protein
VSPLRSSTGATGNNFDFASANGVSSEAVAGDDAPGLFPDTTGPGAEALAGFNGSGDSASVLGNLTTPTDDYAIAGSESGAGGSSDTAFVLDPSGTVGSSAIAGEGFNSDLAGVFGDALHATATTANNVIDILPSLF